MYIGILTNTLGLTSYTPPGYPSFHKWHLGIGGFMTSYNAQYYSGIGIRNQSFWTEAAKFAQYLQFALFTSYFLFIRNRTRKSLVTLLIIGVSFFLTFSVANFFSFLITLSLVSVAITSRPSALLRNVLIGAISFYGIFMFYTYTNQYELNSVMAKNTDRNIENRLTRFELAYKYGTESPFGNKKKAGDTEGAPGALGNLFLDGGIPLLIITAIFMTAFFVKLFKRITKSNYRIIYMSFAAYFIAFNWYGQYFEIYHLFLLSLFTTYFKYDEHNRSII